MPVLEDHIKRVNNKLQQLLKHHRALQKENEQQNRQIATLKQSAEKDKLLIAQLQEQVYIFKAAAGQMNLTDKKVFEKNINQYIREIDKCIGLLSE